VTLLNHPIRYDGKVPEFKGFALRPGENTRDVLGDNGLSADEIEALLKDGVVFAPAAEMVPAE
jgi:crotonobetainyl-CoA:carnitine CoA-transferase CaiB-like acyl-CoA transferase